MAYLAEGLVGSRLNDAVSSLAKNAIRWRGKQAWNLEGEGEEEYRWAIQKSEGRHRLEAMLKLARSEKPISDDGKNWDSNHMLLGVRNGVIELNTGSFRRGKPVDRILSHTDVWFEPKARCPRWEKFVSEIFAGDRELVDFVQKAIGYCLTGSTREQVIFLCYGTGANGKSTFLDVLRHVLGGYACNLPFSAFELKARSAIPNEIAPPQRQEVRDGHRNKRVS